jgi:hypothetical protein
MASVLHLDPIRRGAGAVGPIAAFGHQALEAELAGLPKQVRADLALLEFRDENPLGAPRQQPSQVGLAEMQRQLPQILTVQRQDIEGVELDLVIMPAGRWYGSATRPRRSAGSDGPNRSRRG